VGAGVQECAQSFRRLRDRVRPCDADDVKAFGAGKFGDCGLQCRRV